MRAAVVPALLLVAGSLAAAEPARVPLAAVPLEDLDCHAFCRLTDGAGSLRFATASGALALRVEKGAVRFDTDGNGTVDGADAPAVARGGTVRVPVRRGGTDATAALRVQQADQRYVLVTSAEALAADIDGMRVRLLDGDVDGRFGGAEDRIAVGDAAPAPWSAIVAVGPRLTRIALADDASALTTTPWEGVPATLRLELTQPAEAARSAEVSVLEFVLVHEDGDMALTLAPGVPATVVPGRYTIASETLAVLSRGAGRQQPVTLRGATTEPVVVAGETVLRRGLPDRLAFHASRDAGGAAMVTALHAGDAFGSRWTCEAGGAQVLLRAGGTEKVAGKLDYG